MTYLIHAQWDQEAEVWTATSDQVPGLAIKAETMEELVKRLREVVPENALRLIPASLAISVMPRARATTPRA